MIGKRNLLLTIMLAVAFAFRAPVVMAVEPSGNGEPHLSVEYQDGLLNVEARDYPVVLIIEAIGASAGIDVAIGGEPKSTYSGRFSGLDLANALSRILGGSTSFIMAYDGRGQPERLTILNTVASASAVAKEETAPVLPIVEVSEVEDDGESRIRAHLGNPDPGVRITAIWRLRGISKRKATNLAIDALQGEENPMVRARIASILKQSGGARATDALEDLLSDESPLVRRAAVQALVYLKTDRAIHAIGRALTWRNDDEGQRMMLVEALAGSSSPVARDYLKIASLNLGGAVADKARTALSGGTAAIQSWTRRSSETQDQAGTGPFRSAFASAAQSLAD